jgi:hypothetical protein
VTKAYRARVKEFHDSEEFKPSVYIPLCNATKTILKSMVAEQWDKVILPTECKYEFEKLDPLRYL